MEKVKIMLLSLALFAIVGATLAFKAKYQTSYCTTKTVEFNGQPICLYVPGVSQSCELYTMLTIPLPGQTGIRMCTTNINIAGNCDGKTTCSSLLKLKDDN